MNDHIFEYEVIGVNGDIYPRLSPTRDTEEIMQLVLDEFDESEIENVVVRLEPR